jgi:general secretion pathway protein G
MLNRNTHQKKRGFTLVELLIVIVILAVLAAIAIPRFMDSGTRSKEASLHGDLKLLRNSIELFHNDTGAWPAALADLAGTTAPVSGKDNTGTTKTINAPDFKGPYLQSLPTDPVNGGAAFSYSVTAGSVGKVSSAAAGNGLDGTAYNTW